MFDSNNKKDINFDQTPLVGGAASLITHRLKELSSSRYEFKPTFGAVWEILHVIFAVIVFFLLVLYIFRNIFEIQSVSFNFVENPIMMIPILVIFVFVIDLVKIFISILEPFVFDKNTGLFWKGFRQPNVYNRDRKFLFQGLRRGGARKRNMVRTEEIQGLQILKKVVKGKMDTYVGYELNLVLSNRERVNVINHGNLQKIKKDAQKLGLFLRVPVWDQTLSV